MKHELLLVDDDKLHLQLSREFFGKTRLQRRNGDQWR